jgi:polyphosphate kinase
MNPFEYLNRDVSWLSFNHRVLQEAKDESVPLYERIKFLAIYSSNLDEFFRVRVASLRSFKQLRKKDRKEWLDIKPKKQLKEIRKIVQQQQAEFGAIFRSQILPELRKHQIFLTDDLSYSEEQKTFVRQYFLEHIKPLLEPVVFFDESQEAPFLKNKALYFIVQLKNKGQLALVEVPTDKTDRFVRLPGADHQHYITFVDDILRYHLNEVTQEEVLNAYSIKVSRDAELYIEDEYSGDLITKIKDSLEERNIGLPTRFLYDSAMSQELTDRIRAILQLKKDDMIPGARYHNFNDFFAFPDPTDSDSFRDVSMPSRPHPELESAASIMELLRSKDQVLHFPYQQYKYIPQFIEEAAGDPAVEHIKITLYRVASKSDVVQALLKALEKGKSVTAFIEAKARFDEASNLFWGDRLKEAGGLVLYSYPGIKVHSKLLLIQRREGDLLRNYAYLGTGNFNEKTAKLYCDHALLTADPRLADEVTQVFDLLERKTIIPKNKHLLISPFSTRKRFEQLIEKEIANAQKGHPAYMILKMNSLEDPEMIDHLYRASQAGVRIQLIIRGICCLIPGIEGMSENIEAISIVDRFLEHARVYIFANGGQEIMYTASADWMTRNLDRRIEVVMPIYDTDIFKEIRHIIDLQLQDNTKSRWINAQQDNAYKIQPPSDLPVRAQAAIYDFLAKKY